MIDFESTNQTKEDAIMKTFEDYYWRQFDVLNKDTQLARQFGQDVWDYKQAKINELQARIDGALEKCYIGIRKQGGDHYLELVEDILKGNKDEN